MVAVPLAISKTTDLTIAYFHLAVSLFTWAQGGDLGLLREAQFDLVP